MFVKPSNRSNARKRCTNPLLLLLGGCFLAVPLLTVLSLSKTHRAPNVPDQPTGPSAPPNPLLLLNQIGGGRVFLGGTVAARETSSRPSRFYADAYYYENTGGQATCSIRDGRPDLAGHLYDGSVGDTKTGYTHTLKIGGVLSMNAIIDMGPEYASIPVKYLHATYRPPHGGYLSGSNDGTTWTNLTPRFNVVSNAPYRLFAPQSCRYYQFSQINGGGPGTSATVTDFRLYDASGALIGPPGGRREDAALPGGTSAATPAAPSPPRATSP